MLIATVAFALRLLGKKVTKPDVKCDSACIRLGIVPCFFTMMQTKALSCAGIVLGYDAWSAELCIEKKQTVPKPRKKCI